MRKPFFFFFFFFERSPISENFCLIDSVQNFQDLHCYKLFISVQEPEPIDWEYYRKGIGPRLVDMYKEAYDSMPFDSLGI